MTIIGHRAWALISLATLAVAGCGGEPGGDLGPEATDAVEQPVAPLRRDELPATFRRVVLGRVYQHDDWTLPPADVDGDGAPDVVRDPAYVCDVYAKLRPTYVSGLVRVDGDEPLRAEHVAAYRAIRACVRQQVGKHVRFDFVLNAEHYATPKAVERRLEEVRDAIDPDVYFFDFYQAAYRVKPHVVEAAIRWVHRHDRVVGGNVWGHEVPPGSDFVAVDDATGLEDTEQQIGTLRATHPGLPVLLHLENNPGHPHNLGEAWLFDWDTQHREQALRDRAAVARDLGVRFMYPVFFPLTLERRGDYADYPGHGMVAYDAALDGDMLHTLRALLAKPDAP